MRKVTLPGNAFGATMLLALILCVIVVPLVTVVWLVSLVAPWWVAWPNGVAAALLAFLYSVKFKG